MREIKFRVWDPNTNVMHKNIGMDKISLYDFQGDNITEQDGLDVMQYTELKDKNDQEIYDGDIVKGKRFNDYSREMVRFIGKVTYVPAGFVINGIGQYSGWIHVELNRAYEVIGNICENPELLEVTP